MDRLILNCEGVGLAMRELGRDILMIGPSSIDPDSHPTGARGYEQSSLISTKILGISMASSFTAEFSTKSEYLWLQEKRAARQAEKTLSPIRVTRAWPPHPLLQVIYDIRPIAR